MRSVAGARSSMASDGARKRRRRSTRRSSMYEQKGAVAPALALYLTTRALESSLSRRLRA